MTDEVALYFLQRLLYWRNELFKLDNAAVKDIERTLKSLKLELDKRLQADAEGLATVTDWTRERLEAASHWLDEVLAGANEALGEKISSATMQAVMESLAEHQDILSLGGKASLVRSVGLTSEQVRSWFWETALGGETLQGWVDKAFSSGVKKSLLDCLRLSGIEGKGIGAAVSRMIKTSLDEGINITEREVITLTRTYIQTANVQAQRAVYDANPDIVYGYEWVSVLDNRVCLKCAVLDGTKYKRGEEMPALPCHPRCRCIWRPLVKIKNLGITSEDLGRVTRNWVIREPGNIDAGGKRKILAAGTTNKTFGEWLAKAPYLEKVKILGTTRARLLQEGKIQWADLVDKRTGKLLTLGELGFDNGGNILDYQGRQMGARLWKPLPIAEARSGANMNNYQPNSPYAENCQRCAVTYELRRRGYDVEAMPRQDFYNGKPNACFTGAECFENARVEGRWGDKEKISEANLFRALNLLPDDSRTAIIWQWAKSEGGHIIVCEKTKGKLNFIDPQNGTNQRSNLPKRDKVEQLRGFSFYRMDNLNLNKNFDFSQIAKRKKQ